MRYDRRDRTQILATALLSLVLSSSPAQAQHAPLPSWKTLADESSAVVVADVVQGMLNVIDTEKRRKKVWGPDGKLTGDWNPVGYTVGMLARVRIAEVLKGDAKIKPGDTIGVLVHGYVGCDLPDVPMDKERRVFFLRPVNPNGKEFAHAAVQRIDQAAPPGHRISYDRFDPKGCYTPVEEGYAQVLVPPDKLYFIDKIKQGIAKGP